MLSLVTAGMESQAPCGTHGSDNRKRYMRTGLPLPKPPPPTSPSAASAAGPSASAAVLPGALAWPSTLSIIDKSRARPPAPVALAAGVSAEALS